MNLLFSGCSFTEGIGLDLHAEDPANYCNVFSKMAFVDTPYSMKNIGVRGHSNLRIFLDTCDNIVRSHYDFVFVGWTGYPRHVMWTGLEEYETRRTLMPRTHVEEHNGNYLSFSSEFLNDLRDKFVLSASTHHDILDIVRYINILVELGNLKNTKVYFLNNICQWDNDYFNRIENPWASKLTPYTNKLLSSHNRDNRQIATLYNKMHDDYESLGGIQESKWLNLYDSFQRMQLDVGNDNLHPGKLSHQHYGNLLAQRFITNKL